MLVNTTIIIYIHAHIRNNACIGIRYMVYKGIYICANNWKDLRSHKSTFSQKCVFLHTKIWSLYCFLTKRAGRQLHITGIVVTQYGRKGFSVFFLRSFVRGVCEAWTATGQVGGQTSWGGLCPAC